MPKANYTPEELVQILKRSNTPTIVCEGDDDVIALRQVSEDLGVTNVTILPCGGKDTLINVFRRRFEIKHHLVIFFADKDMWYFSGIPDEFDQIIFTWGYSIENDIYAFSDIGRILTGDEKRIFDDAVKLLSIWFACERRNFLNGNEHHCDVNSRKILDTTLTNFDPDFRSRYSHGLSFNCESQQIFAEFEFELRGKNIFQLLAAILSRPGRRSKYSKDNILEVALTFCKIPILETIRESAKVKFNL